MEFSVTLDTVHKYLVCGFSYCTLQGCLPLSEGEGAWARRPAKMFQVQSMAAKGSGAMKWTVVTCF